MPMTFDQALAQGLEYIRSKWPILYFGLAHHRTTRGDALSFKDRPWLAAIYMDNSPHKVIRKCIQVGISELCLCMLFALAWQGKRGMYLLPDDEWCGTFVGDRMDGLLDRCPEYRAHTGSTGKGTDSRRLKSIYGRTWKFAGTHAKTIGSSIDLRKPKAAFEFQASVLLIDEYDEHVLSDLAWFWDRLADEKNPITCLFGNPSATNVGIDAQYRRTDAKVWQVECHCGHKQILDWYANFVVETPEGSGKWSLRDEDAGEYGEPRPLCTECGKPFDRLGSGHWHATNPDGAAKGSGYAISRLFISVRPDDMRTLYDKFLEAQHNQTLLQNFHNQWLGVPYEHKDDKITEDNLRLCASTNPLIVLSRAAKRSDHLRMIGGVDQGKGNHVSISEVVNGVRNVCGMFVCEDLDDVETYLRAYGVTFVVIDAQGGSYAETRRFCERYDTAVMCYYRPKDEIMGLYTYDEEKAVVKGNRTELCDTMVTAYKSGNMVIPSDFASVLGGQYKAQMLASRRMLDAGGRPIWTKGVDHFFHAEVYATVAQLLSGINNSAKTRKSWRVR